MKSYGFEFVMFDNDRVDFYRCNFCSSLNMKCSTTSYVIILSAITLFSLLNLSFKLATILNNT